MTKHQLERQIKRLQKRINDLEERKNNLSIHGYWDLGYYRGQLSIMEDWLDDIIETEQIVNTINIACNHQWQYIGLDEYKCIKCGKKVQA